MCRFLPLCLSVLVLSATIQGNALAAAPDCGEGSFLTEEYHCRPAEPQRVGGGLDALHEEAKARSGNSPEFRKTAADIQARRSLCHDTACLSAWYREAKAAYTRIIAGGQ